MLSENGFTSLLTRCVRLGVLLIHTPGLIGSTLSFHPSSPAVLETVAINFHCFSGLYRPNSVLSVPCYHNKDIYYGRKKLVMSYHISPHCPNILISNKLHNLVTALCIQVT